MSVGKKPTYARRRAIASTRWEVTGVCVQSTTSLTAPVLAAWTQSNYNQEITRTSALDSTATRMFPVTTITTTTTGVTIIRYRGFILIL